VWLAVVVAAVQVVLLEVAVVLAVCLPQQAMS